MNDNERPDGSVATTVGWVLIAGGVVCAFLAASAETSEWRWFLLAAGNLGVGVGVLLVSLGYLVKAIWFLPGRETAAAIEAETTPEPAPCDWCGQVIAAPNKPCAAFETERLKTFVPRITNEKCLVALREHGLIEGNV
jgi:hypothetical protein